MKILRRSLAIMVILFLICPFLQTSGFATSIDPSTPDNPPIDFQLIDKALCELTISSGAAKCFSYVRGIYNSTTSCSIELKLQKKVLFWWTTVETWNKTEANYQTSINKSYPVVSGKTYRVVSKVSVFCGNNSESATITSNSMEVP